MKGVCRLSCSNGCIVPQWTDCNSPIARELSICLSCEFLFQKNVSIRDTDDRTHHIIPHHSFIHSFFSHRSLQITLLLSGFAVLALRCKYIQHALLTLFFGY